MTARFTYAAGYNLFPDWVIVGAPVPAEDGGGVVVLASSELSQAQLSAALSLVLNSGQGLAATTLRAELRGYTPFYAPTYAQAIVDLFASAWEPDPEKRGAGTVVGSSLSGPVLVGEVIEQDLRPMFAQRAAGPREVGTAESSGGEG